MTQRALKTKPPARSARERRGVFVGRLGAAGDKEGRGGPSTWLADVVSLFLPAAPSPLPEVGGAARLEPAGGVPPELGHGRSPVTHDGVATALGAHVLGRPAGVLAGHQPQPIRGRSAPVPPSPQRRLCPPGTRNRGQPGHRTGHENASRLAFSPTGPISLWEPSGRSRRRYRRSRTTLRPARAPRPQGGPNSCHRRSRTRRRG